MDKTLLFHLGILQFNGRDKLSKQNRVTLEGNYRAFEAKKKGVTEILFGLKRSREALGKSTILFFF